MREGAQKGMQPYMVMHTEYNDVIPVHCQQEGSCTRTHPLHCT